MRLREIALLSVVALAVSCGNEKAQSGKHTVNLAGTWQLTLPAGFQHTVEITAEAGARYRVTKPGLSLNGIYEVRGNRFVMAVPNDPRLTEFVWQIEDADHLTLIEEPPASKTGAKYRNAKLVRQK